MLDTKNVMRITCLVLLGVLGGCTQPSFIPWSALALSPTVLPEVRWMMAAEHTKGKRPSSWDKHTKTRAGGKEKKDERMRFSHGEDDNKKEKKEVAKRKKDEEKQQKEEARLKKEEARIKKEEARRKKESAKK